MKERIWLVELESDSDFDEDEDAITLDSVWDSEDKARKRAIEIDARISCVELNTICSILSNRRIDTRDIQAHCKSVKEQKRMERDKARTERVRIETEKLKAMNNSGDIWSADNPAPKRSTNPDIVGDEDAYINKKLPDMRIDRNTGRVVRMNPKIQTSFPNVTQEEWDRMMSK